MGKLISMEWRMAALNLLRNRRRSLLSVLIIAIAVFALTSAGGFGLYTYQALRESTARIHCARHRAFNAQPTGLF